MDGPPRAMGGDGEHPCLLTDLIRKTGHLLLGETVFTYLF